ncbi:MAG: phage terminase large subunit [Candidatus Thorarchaeota archaeon]
MNVFPEKKLKNELLNKDITNNYTNYLTYVYRNRYIHTKHTRYICSILDRVEKGELTRVIFTLPPRHSKSYTITESFPSYFIGKNPDRKVISVGYGDKLAKKFGRKNRQKITEFGQDLFNITISKNNSSITNWSISGHEGMMISAGFGGTITGEGAHLLLIDDPIKNRLEADSQTYRDRIWSEYTGTLRDRLQEDEKGRIVIVTTRWHEDDLIGRILNKEKNKKYNSTTKWLVVNLPAIAEKNDLLGRKEGEALAPELGFTVEVLNEIKEDAGSRTWNAKHQGRPSPEEGNIVNRNDWKFYKERPSEFDEIIQSWDMAFKDKKTSSYVTGQIWGRLKAKKYLLDQFRAQVSFTGTIIAFKTLTAKWPMADRKLVEDKANGPAIIETLKDEIEGIIAAEPHGSKIARAKAVAPQIEAGNVYLPDPIYVENTKWVYDYIEEWASFPNGLYDDQVDSSSQGLFYLKNAYAYELQIRYI